MQSPTCASTHFGGLKKVLSQQTTHQPCLPFVKLKEELNKPGSPLFRQGLHSSGRVLPHTHPAKTLAHFLALEKGAKHPFKEIPSPPLRLSPHSATFSTERAQSSPPSVTFSKHISLHSATFSTQQALSSLLLSRFFRTHFPSFCRILHPTGAVLLPHFPNTFRQVLRQGHAQRDFKL